MKRVSIYVDGSCIGNPGPGGWSVLLMYVGANGQRHEKEASGYELRTTNNRMELLAAIRGLEALREQCQVELFMDSQYVITMANGGNARINNDLVESLRQAIHRHTSVMFHYVRGHAGDLGNERVDTLARRQAEQAERASRAC